MAADDRRDIKRLFENSKLIVVLLISLDSSAIAITLGSSSYILHHRRAHDNSKLHDGSLFKSYQSMCTDWSFPESFGHTQKTAQAKYITKNFSGSKKLAK